MAQDLAMGARPTKVAVRGSGLALAGSLLLLAPLALFALTLWLTDGAPLRPMGVELETAQGIILPESAR